MEKCLLWGLPLVIISLDVAKAFDCLNLMAVVEVMERYKVPIRLRYATLREVLAVKVFSFSFFGEQVGPFPVIRGLRQGSPLSSFLFAIIIGDILNELDLKWRPLGLGINLGRFGGNDLAFGTFWSEFRKVWPQVAKITA